METLQLLGSTLGIGLLSGVRLYATVLALGLGIRFGLFELNGGLEQLRVLADWRVLALAGAAYLIEFFADKVPWLDSAWDAAHTFIRPLGAALLAATALGGMEPVPKILLALASGGIALTGHSSKAATRLAVNHSPEPFSNIALSAAEDLMVPAGLWVFVNYPLVALGVVAAFLLLFAWLSPKVFRLLRLEVAALGALLRSWSAGEEAEPAALPAELGDVLPSPPEKVIRCAATRSVGGLSRSIGYLCFGPEEIVFVTRRGFRRRTVSIPRASLQDIRRKRGLLLDTLVLRAGNQEWKFDLFKDVPPAALPVVARTAAAG